MQSLTLTKLDDLLRGSDHFACVNNTTTLKENVKGFFAGIEDKGTTHLSLINIPQHLKEYFLIELRIHNFSFLPKNWSIACGGSNRLLLFQSYGEVNSTCLANGKRLL